MPHFIVEYSANLETEVDMQAFCEHLRAAAAEIETFPTAGIRVRAFAAQHYAIADGNPDHAFIDISIRLREGRSPEVKQHASSAIFEAAKAFVSPLMQARPLALSLEMRDIDAAYSPKIGTIRDYL